MYVINPVIVTDSDIYGYTLPEDDTYSAWLVGTTYNASDRVYVASTHTIYESMQGSNTGNDPTTDDGTWWEEVGPTNSWAMFDQTVGSSTEHATGIEVRIKIDSDDEVDGIALLDLVASYVKLELLDINLGSESVSASPSSSTSPSGGASASSSVSGSPSSSASTSSSLSSSPSSSASSSESSSPSTSVSPSWGYSSTLELLAAGESASPFIDMYDSSDWSKIPNPSTLPANAVYGAAFSPDGSLMAVGHSLTPFVTIYNTYDWSKVSNPSNLPPSTGFGTAFSPDGSLMAVAHFASPYVTIYNTSDWSKVSNPSNLPTGTGQAVAFSPDGSLMAVAHSNSPYITIYNTSDWSKVSNPSNLPTGTGQAVAFSPDGSLMAVAHYTSPYVTIYNTSDWSKVNDPVDLPAGVGLGVTFDPDGDLMVVTHTISPYMTIYNTSDWSKVSNPSSLPPATCYDVAFNSDGSLMALAHDLSPYITIYNTSNWSKAAGPSSLPAGNCNTVEFFNFDTTSSSPSASPSVGSGSYWKYEENLTIDPDAPASFLNLDVPKLSADAILRVTLTGTNVAVGTLAFGTVTDLGGTLWGASLGLIDYSTKSTNDYGITSIVERVYSKTFGCDLYFTHANLRANYRFLANVRATPCVWIGSDEDIYDATIVYGFYSDFEIILQDYSGCYCSIEIEGLT